MYLNCLRESLVEGCSNNYPCSILLLKVKEILSTSADKCECDQFTFIVDFNGRVSARILSFEIVIYNTR